jgi:uncharacterized phage protein gp47/JayE
MTYGITPQGFKAKRLADINDEIDSSLKAIFGDSINLLPSGVLGQLKGVFSERESLLWELAEAVYQSQYPTQASDVTLDNVVSITGITRNPGVKSKATLHFHGDVGTIIPVGSIFSVLNSPTSRFILGNDITLAAGVDAVQKITFGSVPDAGSFKIKYRNETTALIAYNATALDVQNALNALNGLSAVVVTGDFTAGFTITFTGADGERFQKQIEITNNLLTLVSVAVVATPSDLTIGVPNAIALIDAEFIGATSAPAYSLTVIQNPISGLNTVTNPLDAVVGRDIESDADLKARRAESLARAGAGTLTALISRLADLDGVNAVVGFENITFLTDIDGRPPKSFEMVVDGGLDADIAQDIWENKPAGIETFGSETESITDSQGFPQNVKFSRPTDLNIYVEMDLTTDPARFPVNGATQARDAIIAFGNALGIGADVIVIPQLVCALNSIPGILDIDVRIGIAPAPTLDNNIPVDADEISRWDTSRTVINLI